MVLPFALCHTDLAILVVPTPVEDKDDMTPVTIKMSNISAKTLNLIFTLAANGEQLGILPVVLPWRFDGEKVYNEIQVCLLGLTVIDAFSMPLYQYLAVYSRKQCMKNGTMPITELHMGRPCFEFQPVEDIEICLVATRPPLQNVRAERILLCQSGWRKPKHEFRDFVISFPLPQVCAGHIAEYCISGRMQKLGKARVRDLAPLMLQAVAADIRKKATRRLRPKYDFHVHGGSNHRTWDGCRHAMMLLSGCSALVVDKFLWDWLTAMEEVVEEIRAEVQRYPFQTYFS